MGLGVFAKYIGYLLLAGGVFALTHHYSSRFLDWLRFQSLGTRDYIVKRLEMMFLEVPPQRILAGLFFFSFGLGTLVFLAFLPKLFPGIPFAIITMIVGWKAPKPIVDYLYQRRVNTIVLQMVDGLSLMSNAMKSGLPVGQALAVTAREMPNPLKQEFNYILNENKLGLSLEDAFTNFSNRVKSDDIEMFVTSVNILTETGADQAQAFDTIVTTIRERIKVEKKIQAMTAQGFYQGMIVMATPPILGTVFYQTEPDFMAPLFSTAIGWIIIMIVLALEIIGFFVIMRVIKIEV